MLSWLWMRTGPTLSAVRLTAPLPPLPAADSRAVATSLTQWQLAHPDETAQHRLPAPARRRRSAR